MLYWLTKLNYNQTPRTAVMFSIKMSKKSDLVVMDEMASNNMDIRCSSTLIELKNIKNITIDDINNIYSLIIGEPRTAGKVEWTEEKDFVIAVFKIEESSLPQYNTVEMGIQINEDLNVDHVWWYINDKGTGVVYQPLRNHNKITKYLIKEGFNV